MSKDACLHGLHGGDCTDEMERLVGKLIELFNKIEDDGTIPASGSKALLQLLTIEGERVQGSHFRDVLVFFATSDILDHEGPYPMARLFAEAVSAMEMIDACFAEAIGDEYIEENWNDPKVTHAKDLVSLQHEREVVRFFAKRVPCNCLNEKYEDAKKVSKQSYCARRECGKSDSASKFSVCAGCKLVAYCGRECQVKHWPVHKESCRAIQATRKANQSKLTSKSTDTETDQSDEKMVTSMARMNLS